MVSLPFSVTGKGPVVAEEQIDFFGKPLAVMDNFFQQGLSTYHFLTNSDFEPRRTQANGGVGKSSLSE
jgi:hypothetical protein